MSVAGVPPTDNEGMRFVKKVIGTDCQYIRVFASVADVLEKDGWVPVPFATPEMMEQARKYFDGQEEISSR